MLPQGHSLPCSEDAQETACFEQMLPNPRGGCPTRDLQASRLEDDLTGLSQLKWFHVILQLPFPTLPPPVQDPQGVKSVRAARKEVS